MTNAAVEEKSLEYATPLPRSPGRTLAAAAVLFGGVAMSVVGGCFLIGVLLTARYIDTGLGVQQSFLDLTYGQVVLITALSLLAAASFAAAAILIVLGTRALLRITQV